VDKKVFGINGVPRSFGCDWTTVDCGNDYRSGWSLRC